MTQDASPQEASQNKSTFDGYGLIKAIDIILIVNIVCCILYLIGSPIMALLTLLGSFLSLSLAPLILSVIAIAQMIVYLVLAFRARKELKNKDVKFVDTVIYNVFVSLIAWAASFLVNYVSRILSGLLTTRFIGNSISSFVGQVVGAVIGLGLLILFLSKSKQIKAWFNLETNAIRYSRFWPWISKLPKTITDEALPEVMQPNTQEQPAQQQPQSAAAPVVQQQPTTAATQPDFQSSQQSAAANQIPAAVAQQPAAGPQSEIVTQTEEVVEIITEPGDDRVQ